jgi:hypothetical protein
MADVKKMAAQKVKDFNNIVLSKKWKQNLKKV